jgi:hypothetical protein
MISSLNNTSFFSQKLGKFIIIWYENLLLSIGNLKIKFNNNNKKLPYPNQSN